MEDFYWHRLTNVAADGRDQVVGLYMFKVESPQLNLGVSLTDRH